MIPAFHDYSLEPKITKCGDLLYVCSTTVCTILGRKEGVLSRLTFYHTSCINCLQYATFNLILCKKIGRIIEHDYVKMLLKHKICTLDIIFQYTYLNWFFDWNFFTRILIFSETIGLFHKCEHNFVTGILIRKKSWPFFVTSLKTNKSKAI